MRAALIKLYRNTLFRLSLLGAVFFVVALIIALGNVYFLTISSELRQVDKSLAAEVEEFQTILDKAGLIPLGNEIFLRSGSGDRHYLLTSRNQNGEDMVIGSLGEQVVTLINQEKTVIGEEGDADFTKVDFILVIPATDTVPATERRMRGLSGYLQIDGDEMDLLAEHLNDMLDHIDRLMKAMRYAGDSIAHDLRSPLTRLRTRLETAASEISDPMAQETLFAASDDADQLLKTFDSVLRIARLEAGERREMLSKIDPKPILDDIAELYEPACEDVGLSFSSDIRGGHLISADRGLISQAVSNLIENAIKYTPKGGAIHFSLKKNKDGRPEISIVDEAFPQEAGSALRNGLCVLMKAALSPAAV